MALDRDKFRQMIYFKKIVTLTNKSSFSIVTIEMVVFRMIFHGKKFIGMIPFDPIGNPVLIDLCYLFKKKE